MAVKFIAKDDTLEDFRLAFNDQSANSFGDIANLSGSISATNLVDAMNETITIAVNTAGFTLRDSTSSTQQIGGGNTLNVVGAANEITAVVSATDTLTIGLPDNVTITGNLTTSGTGTHTLGTISITGNTILSSNATAISINDDLTLAAGKTLTADLITSSTDYVDFGAKNISTSGHFYTNSPEGIIFEGTTADAFETKLISIDPTADRLISLPNVTGTLITTGDTGTITATMLAANAITAASITNNSITIDKMANDSIGQAQMKDVVDLQIQNSSGGILKQIFGAGS
tara:strand:- start:1468 stop:2331 length:864 start_codon:yes stop_codon:yes gene_type:complete